MQRRAFLKSLPIGGAAMWTASCSKQPEPAAASTERSTAAGTIVRLDPAIDELVPKDAQIEKLAGGFTFIEGPLWRPSQALWCGSGHRMARSRRFCVPAATTGIVCQRADSTVRTG